MKRCVLIVVALCSLSGTAQAELKALVMGGLGGEPRFQERFDRNAQDLADILSEGEAGRGNVQLLIGETAKRSNFFSAMTALREHAAESDRVAIFLIGHGSYDQRQYKFNVAGPDITHEDISEALAGLGNRHILFVNTSSASGELQETLNREGRIIVTATKSGNEKNATYFGDYWVASFTDKAADRDKNDSISAQEAFDYAARHVADYYERGARLATEHPRIQGANPQRFALARLSAAIVATTPEQGDLLLKKVAIEGEIDTLRLNKSRYSTQEYFQRLQELALELALVQEQIDGFEP